MKDLARRGCLIATIVAVPVATLVLPQVWQPFLGVLGAAAVIAAIGGAQPTLPESSRRSWNRLAVASAAVLVSIVLRAVAEWRSSDSIEVMAAVAALAAYPAAIAALARWWRPDSSDGVDLPAYLDAGIVALAAFASLWVLVLDRVLADQSASRFDLALGAAFPVLDVVLLAAVVRLGAAVKVRSASVVLVMGSIAGVAVLDAIYSVVAVVGEVPFPRDAVWVPSLLLLAVAVLHPDAAKPWERHTLEAGWLTWHRFALLFVATLAVPLVDMVWGNRSNGRLVTATASAVLFILVLTRVSWLMTAVRRSTGHLEHVAFHDPLTGVPNRSLFSDRVSFALSQRSVTSALLLVDLDDFKVVNDSLGHEAGDELLRSVADRLGECVRDGDIVARLGGDEFAVLLGSVADGRDAAFVAQRILDSLSRPVSIAGHEIAVAASIGVALGADAEDVDSFLRSADTAMYLAKGRGKSCYEFFEHAMHEAATERLELKAALRRAVDEHQFELHYQPIIDFRTQRVVSMEALLRWYHPERGPIMPDRFISLAEETGLIVPIGRWALSEACRQAKEWQACHPDLAELDVGVNISVRQLRDPTLPLDVTRALEESGLDPGCLTLEVTESMLMDDAQLSGRVLTGLKDRGVKIAIDDFGTGYSSFGYLRDFPFDVLKVDKSFVDDLGEGGRSHAIVSSILHLARSLDASTIAEGIEDFTQARVLSDLGCRWAQGYLIAKPMRASEITPLLSSAVGALAFAVQQPHEPALPAWRRRVAPRAAA